MRMTERGHRLVLASGRPLPAILDTVREAALSLPGLLVIANNGALVYELDSGKPLLEMRLAPLDVSALFALARRHDIHIHTYLEDAVLTDRRDPETDYYCKYVHMPVRELAGSSLEEVLTVCPFKCLAIHLADRSKLEALRKDAEILLGQRVASLFSSDCYLEFFDRRAGKGNALRFVCDLLRVPLRDAFAAGDAENDISMLQTAGTGVAMQNASDTVKKAADLVTSRGNGQDGLIEIIEQYFL